MSPDSVLCPKFPFHFEGKIVKGHGRGAKELGIPTANLESDTVNVVSEHLRLGIYYGKCSIFKDYSTYYPMVMSFGWNPTYPNSEKSLEIHIISDKSLGDLRDTIIKADVMGWIREELKFNSKEELMSCIKNDIEVAMNKLGSST